MDSLDYKISGLSINQAMVDSAKRSRRVAGEPLRIKWGDLWIQTSDTWLVLEHGHVRAEILYASAGTEQGFDLSVDGWFELANDHHLACLRTWKDERFEDVVEYPFFSRNSRLDVWNVYKTRHSEQLVVEDKWTGNAGFWVERTSNIERIYHCSHGSVVTPDFDSFVFKLVIPDATGPTSAE